MVVVSIMLHTSYMSPTKYACGSNFVHGELFIHQACGCSHSKWSCTMIDSSSFWNSKLNSEPNWGQHMWLIAPPFKTLERKVSLHPLSDGVWLVNSQREANLQFLENKISTTTQLSQTYHKAQVVKVVFSLFQIKWIWAEIWWHSWQLSAHFLYITISENM